MSRPICALLSACICLLGVLAPQSATAQIYWTEAPEFAPPGTGYIPEFGDLDGDGDHDLIYAVVTQSYRNVGSPFVPSWLQDNSLVAGVDYVNRMTTCLADLDADGDLDLSVGQLYGEVWRILYYQNVGSPAHPVWQADNSMYEGIGGYETHPELVDLDADGDLDLLEATGSSSLRAYRNTGTPVVPSWTRDDSLLNGVSPPYWLMDHNFGDLDGDGDLDLVITGRYGDGPVTCYENLGSPQDPTWVENPGLLTGVPLSVGGWGSDLADLDADGDPDLLVDDGYRTTVYLNCGAVTSVDTQEASTWSSIKALYGRPRSN